MQPEALSINIPEPDEKTPEYRAATLLGDLIRRSSLPGERGTISLHTDLFFAGQAAEQIDILLHASFPGGLVRKIHRASSPDDLEVRFQDVLAVIEVKAKPLEDIAFSKFKVEVHYDGVWKSASSQSHRQVFSVKAFLCEELKWEPWVCNLIFFPNLVEADLPTSPHNYLASDSSFQNLLERLQPPKKKNAFRSRKRSMLFSCVFAQDESQQEERNRQIEDLLRVKRSSPSPQLPTLPRPLPPPPPPMSMLASLPPTSPPPPQILSRRQRKSLPLFFLWAALILLVIGGFARIWIGRRTIAEKNITSSLAMISGLPSPTLRTCAAVTPGCGCNPSTRFRQGKPIFIQFIGRQQKPSEESVHDPQGKVLPLSFRHSSSRHTGSGCFVAKYIPSHDAAPGSYFVQATSETADGHLQGVLSRGFQITP